MGSFIVVLIVVAALLVFVALLFALVARKTKPQSGVRNELWPFYAKRLLSEPEQILYSRLVSALPEHIILAQAQLTQLLGVKSGHSFQAWNNRISRMSVDFAVCNKDSSIVAVIEFDDVAHLKEHRAEDDAKKSRALASAGVRILRWQVESLPDVDAIKLAFKNEAEQ